jgi:hypothetical protein
LVLEENRRRWHQWWWIGWKDLFNLRIHLQNRGKHLLFKFIV